MHSITLISTLSLVLALAAAQLSDPISPLASAVAGEDPKISATEAASIAVSPTATNVNPGATAKAGGTTLASTEMVQDPANGGFPGGFPSPLPDVPVSIVFLFLFAFGAFTHISIYRANSARGHKFLLSDLMFDFCMIRTLTSIFRIAWSFTNTSSRGVILFALIFENGGAAVIFAVNLFFAQRIFRAMHPKIGWNPIFTVASLGLILSVPMVIIINIISLSVSFFSVGKEAQLASTETALRFGASWNMMLAVMPLVVLLVAGFLPTKSKPEQFGTGSLVTKAALLAYGSMTLAVGAAVRLAANVNPEPATTQDVLYGKALFYTTGFMLEILVVAMYAVFRIDLLFHIPDGSSKPGDYSAAYKVRAKKSLDEMEYDIEERLGLLGIEYENISGQIITEGGTQVIIAKLFATKPPVMPQTPSSANTSTERLNPAYLPLRLNRVSRCATLMEAFEPFVTPHITEDGRYITGAVEPPTLPDGFYYSEKRGI